MCMGIYQFISFSNCLLEPWQLSIINAKSILFPVALPDPAFLLNHLNLEKAFFDEEKERVPTHVAMHEDFKLTDYISDHNLQI